MRPGGPRVVPPGNRGGGVPHSPWICRVGVWRRVRWMRRRWWQVVRVQCLSRVGVGLGGLLGVPGRIRFLLGGEGRPLVVGGVVGWSAWWVVLPFHALVMFLHRGLWPGGVGWWAVVVMLVGVVLAVVVVVVVVVLVGGGRWWQWRWCWL